MQNHLDTTDILIIEIFERNGDPLEPYAHVTIWESLHEYSEALKYPGIGDDWVETIIVPLAEASRYTSMFRRQVDQAIEEWMRG